LKSARPADIGQRSRYQIHQLVGARNSRPAPEVAKVVGTFVEEINSVRPMIDDTGRDSAVAARPNRYYGNLRPSDDVIARQHRADNLFSRFARVARPPGCADPMAGV
jgi:hypothetical protein